MTDVMSMEFDASEVEHWLDRLGMWIGPEHMDHFAKSSWHDILKFFTSERFNSESFEGEGWAPLSESTVMQRADQGFSSGPINYRTGQMRRFLEQSVPEGGPSGVGYEYSWPESPDSEMKKKLVVAQGKAEPIPARPVIGANDVMPEMWVEMAAMDLDRYMR